MQGFFTRSKFKVACVQQKIHQVVAHHVDDEILSVLVLASSGQVTP